MQSLNYEAPTDINSAIAMLAKANKNTKIFAGGTDLLVQLREEFITPSLFIDIKKIKETKMISIDESEIRIGAAVTGAELSEQEDVRILLPGLVEAVELIGSAQIQGRATIGGNICNASPAADSIPALITASAVAEVAGPAGFREVPIQDILAGPGQTTLDPTEFVITLRIPKPEPLSADAYLRFIPRTEMDIAVVGASAAITLDLDGTCRSARLALGAVAPTARLVENVAPILIGHKLSEKTLAEVTAAARAACDPIDDKRGTIEFRVHVAGILAERAIKIAWQRAEVK